MIRRSPAAALFNGLAAVLTSLRLTVVLLALAFVLVFWGTIAQVSLGLYRAQNEFFRSFFIYAATPWGWRVPIFPGGYLVGGLLLLNLFAAHFRYYRPGAKKIGIVLIHSGIVVLLGGQLLTDIFSVESQMHLRVGQTKNYSEKMSSFELAVTDISEPDMDKVVAIPARRLRHGGDISHPELPFAIRVLRYLANSALATAPRAGFEKAETTHGVTGLWWRELPHVTETDRRDIPSGIIELIGGQQSLGTYLVSGYLEEPQTFVYGGRTYRIALRPERLYKMHSITLEEFRHDRYPGTDIPKNFSSLVRVRRAETNEDRRVLIYMNSPLRYAGETYYQASYDADDGGSVLQVVRNPAWLTPYFGCVLVGSGLIVQFLMHLVGFLRKRNAS